MSVVENQSTGHLQRLAVWDRVPEGRVLQSHFHQSSNGCSNLPGHIACSSCGVEANLVGIYTKAETLFYEILQRYAGIHEESAVSLDDEM